jgi:hypothetical protein
MQKTLLILILTIFSHFLQAQPKLVSATYIGETPDTLFTSYSANAIFSVHSFKLTYITSNIHGDTTIASGFLAVPDSSGCDSMPMVAYTHGTVLNKSNVPSANNAEAFFTKIFASTGAAAVAPDYLGLGVDEGLHPYLHASSEATATIDLMRAAKEFLKDSLNVNCTKETFITGNSQGGHAAMATLKYINDSALASEFDIIAAAPISGPYDILGTLGGILMKDEPFAYPSFVCYALFSMNRVYGDIFQNYDELLKSPYDTLIPPLFNGNYGLGIIDSLLPDTLSLFIRDSVINNFRKDSIAGKHPIRRALKAQDVYNWKPTYPMELYYCNLDEIVNPQNAITTASIMSKKGANVSAIDSGAYNHGSCALPGLQGAISLFLSKKRSCNFISVPQTALDDQIQVFPNPAGNWFSILGFDNQVRLTVLTADGQPILRKQLSSGATFSTHTWPAGIFTLVIQLKDEVITHKLVKQ